MTIIGKSFPLIALALGLVFVTGVVTAGHNGAVVDIDEMACGETVFEAAIIDPNETHKVGNMRLVVHADDETQVSGVIPTDGSSVSLTTDPSFTNTVETKTIMWRVFGGAERDYDSPLWNGHGQPGFTADINAYATQVGGFSWVVSGPDDPNPFTTWHELEVQTCQLTKDMCKGGGWADFGFRNQGLCIQYANTGKDSR